jgi:hypothetical protein
MLELIEDMTRIASGYLCIAYVPAASPPNASERSMQLNKDDMATIWAASSIQQ